MDTAQVIARFEAERQALAVMAHPAIAQVFDAGATPQGRPYFVMEYVQGRGDHDLLQSTSAHDSPAHRPVPPGLRRRSPRAPEGHHPSRSQAVEHSRDPAGRLAVPKIIDFGLAKATTQHLTERTLFTEFGAIDRHP